MFLKKSISLFIAVTFLTSSIYPNYARAELILPAPNQFVPLSNTYSFPVLKGMKFDPADPLKMEFIIDTADQKNVSAEEASRLIRYFLAGLTTPEEDTWVNMSPYEADKIIPKNLSETDLGKDLLSQDYILKQLSSSLTYPESDTGKDFWDRTYQEVLKVAKTTKLPVNTFNKIWITPDKAVVYEHENFAMVSEATLKTMLEEDYLALKNNVSSIQKQKNMKEGLINQVNAASSKVMRETILPKINADVNSGKNFATLRQIYYSLILGVWFKKKFKDSLYKAYINQGKIKGIDLADKNAKDKIYNLYVEAFKKGIYNYIKPEKDLGTGRKIKRQYFSGGATMLGVDSRTIRKNLGSNEGVINAAPTLGPAKMAVIELRTGINPAIAGTKQSASPVTGRDLYEYAISKAKRVIFSSDIAITMPAINFVEKVAFDFAQSYGSKEITEQDVIAFLQPLNNNTLTEFFVGACRELKSATVTNSTAASPVDADTRPWWASNDNELDSRNPAFRLKRKDINEVAEFLADYFTDDNEFILDRSIVFDSKTYLDLNWYDPRGRITEKLADIVKLICRQRGNDSWSIKFEMGTKKAKIIRVLLKETGLGISTLTTNAESEIDPSLRDLRLRYDNSEAGAPYGGIDMQDIKVNAAPSSTPVNLPMIDLKNFQGFTFRIIKIEAITNLNAIFGATFMKVEGKAGKENLQLAYAK